MPQTGKNAMAEKTFTACLLIIGNEILSGRTQDRNLQFLGAFSFLSRVKNKTAFEMYIPDALISLKGLMTRLACPELDPFSTFVKGL